jgi:hypothetical protein
VSAAIATTHEPIAVAIRPAVESEIRMCQAQWTRELETGWKHRAHMPGDKPGTPATLATRHAQLEERSGVQLGKPGFDNDGKRHEPHFLAKGLLLKAHRLLVDHLLERCSLVVAVVPDLPTEPVGWAVFDERMLHFVFVIPAARRCRIGTELVLATACSAASHMTPAGRSLAKHLRGAP